MAKDVVEVLLLAKDLIPEANKAEFCENTGDIEELAGNNVLIDKITFKVDGDGVALVVLYFKDLRIDIAALLWYDDVSTGRATLFVVATHALALTRQLNGAETERDVYRESMLACTAYGH